MTKKVVHTISEKSDQVKGRGKEVVGTLTGNEDLESEGKADRRAGEVKHTLDHAKGKIEELIDKAGDRGEEAIDKIKDARHSK
jgi:uncharacterized protein YjbJ (UPF0337 family)